MFGVPFVGSVTVLYVVSLLFIACNLTVGITLSSLARNQLQAMQLTFFYFLPKILLSGFMFPFRGMPEWAQWLGSVLPLTYFKRLVRGILLKGNDWPDLWPNLWPLIVFALVVMVIAVQLLSQDARLKRACDPLPCRARRRLHGRPRFPRARSAGRRPLRLRSRVAACASSPGRDIPAEWWTVFGSPELDALVQRALRDSPTLDQARARLDAGAGASRGARRRHAVSAVRSRRRARSASASTPRRSAFRTRRIPGPFNVFSLGVNASYNFDIFGGTRRELEALAAEVDYQAYELEAARLTLASNVVATAIRQSALRAQIELIERIVAAQRHELAIAEERYQAGGVAWLAVQNQRALVAADRGHAARTARASRAGGPSARGASGRAARDGARSCR